MPLTMLLLAAAVLLLPSPLPRAPVIAVRLRHRWRTKPQGDVVLAWLLALAGELRGGSDTLRALRVCGARYDVAPRATRTAALGGDVPAALRADAAQTPILHAVAAAWSISDRTGAGLAGVLDNIADGHRRTAEVRRSLAVEVAGPRATARIMGMLPVFGLGLAFLLGADPVTWLVSSPVGLACLLTGIGLNLIGHWWITRIVRGIEDVL